MIKKILSFFGKKSEKAETSAEKIAEQELKNLEFVWEIIDGHYDAIPEDQKSSSKSAFAKWQKVQKVLFQEAPKKLLKKRNSYVKEGNLNVFKPNYSYLIEPAKKEGAEIFAKNFFTEPFPSLHDMPEWALATQITDIFTLKGISPEESSKFLIHVKNHFVNHNMVRGIIQFDIYRNN